MRQPIARIAITSIILAAGVLSTPASAQQDSGEKAYGDLLSRMLPASGASDIFEMIGMSPDELGERAMRCRFYTSDAADDLTRVILVGSRSR